MTNDPSMEPEVLAARLKALGCPYPAEDYRAPVWLSGFQFGYDQASNKAIERMEKLAGKNG